MIKIILVPIIVLRIFMDPIGEETDWADETSSSYEEPDHSRLDPEVFEHEEKQGDEQ